MICPPLSGPETMIVWTTKGTLNGKLREVEILLAQEVLTAEACRRIAVSEQTPAFAGVGSIIGGARRRAKPKADASRRPVRGWAEQTEK
jgi:hypothetical protein